MNPEPRVRLLYFADIRFPLERANGIQTMETCHALARRGLAVTLVVRPDTERPARSPYEFYALPAIEALRIETAPVTGPPFARRAGYLAFSAGRAIGTARADVLFTRDLGVAAALLRIPPGLRAPIVYESHGYAPAVAAALPELVATARPPRRAKLARLRRREARVWRQADGYVTITAALRDELRAELGERHPVTVVPDGTRIGSADLPQPRVTGRPVVAYAGHLYAWKGVDVLLDALAQLPEVEGLVVGGHHSEPDLARLQARSERLGIHDRVRFTGPVPPAQVPAWLRSADVLVLPNPPSAISTRFTSPLKLFEYMAAGRPVVATDLPAIREVLQDGRTALLVTAGSADAIAEGVRRIVADPALGRRLAREAACDVAGFSWDRRAERLETLFREVAGARP